MPWPLLAVLAVQAALSASMVRARTAFGDEALYLSAGHLEWSHWLHGTPIPAYQTWFSGAPVIYPPIGAIADSLGGLAAARLLSLVFMLGVTSLVWGTATRLLDDQRAAFFAAALFAVLAPTLHLGSFATYDAPALLLLAAATWCAAGARSGQHATRRMIAAGILLALANATKYATALYDPTVLGVAFLSSWPDAGWQVALRRAALLAGIAAAVLAVLLALGGPGYLTGIRVTTTGRVHGTDAASLVFGRCVVVDRGRAGPGRRRGRRLRGTPAVAAGAAPGRARALGAAGAGRPGAHSDRDVAEQARRLRCLVRCDRGRLPAEQPVPEAGGSGGAAGRPDPGHLDGHGPGARHDRLAGRDRARQGRPADDRPRRALSRGNHRCSPVLPAEHDVAAVVEHRRTTTWSTTSRRSRGTTSR